jgi:hypothetical protein
MPDLVYIATMTDTVLVSIPAGTSTQSAPMVATQAPSGELRYTTHHNYNRPFMVRIVDRTISVHERTDSPDANSYHDATWPDRLHYGACPVYRTPYRELFIGTSPENDMTAFSGGHGPQFDGNSILIREEFDGPGFYYTFIGDRVFHFRTELPIVTFSSPVGNNDVPYPYATDAGQNKYLLIEDVVLRHRVDTPAGDFDPYDRYYEMSLMTTDLGCVPPRMPYIPGGFDEIEELWIGNEQFTMTYRPKAGKNYDRFVEELSNGGEVAVVRAGGMRSVLSREQYISIMQDYATRIGVTPIVRDCPRGDALMTETDITPEDLQD